MFHNRSYCGELRSTDAGKNVDIAGWVHSKRDLGGLIFVQVRDVSGIVQVACDSSEAPDIAAALEALKPEYTVLITGTVKMRARDAVNSGMATGEIEIAADRVTVLGTSEVPPFPIESREPVGEETRLRYRFLDLRRADMKEALVARHRVMQNARNYLSAARFIEIETPILNKSTPEGARDFLVPSRINPGEFYALPQSPQLFKQILMVSGYDRYFQIVKCFRDEDLRNDRQPEFTQIDMELSFVDESIIMNTIDGLLKSIIQDIRGVDIDMPVPHITYDQAMERFGCDAPDMRYGLELADCTGLFSKSGFRVFTSAIENGGAVKAFAAPDNGFFSRKKLDEYGEKVKVYGAGGLPFVKFNDGAFDGGIAKFLSGDEVKGLSEILGLKDRAVVFFASDRMETVNFTLSNLRKIVAGDLGLIDGKKLSPVWVTDFPLFEYNNEDGRFYAKHHPFTAPKHDHIAFLDSLSPVEPEKVRARAYDIVLNGVEIGGGSIRISDQALQSRIFSLLGISEEEARVKFSFLLEALKYGAPPHGGIALGLDRILMILLERNSIRDVIAFPKTARGQCLMSGAPSPISDEQMNDLSIKVVDERRR